jgi:hypothetical protein
MTLTDKVSVRALGPALWLFITLCGARAESPFTACTLVSATEVGHALGVAINDDSQRVTTEALTICLFKDFKGGAVSVLVRHNPSRDWIAEQENRMGRSANFRAVGGLEDTAFVLDRRGDGAVLCVFRGEYYLQISAFRLGPSDAIVAAAKALAQAIASRIPMRSNVLEADSRQHPPAVPSRPPAK